MMTDDLTPEQQTCDASTLNSTADRGRPSWEISKQDPSTLNSEAGISSGLVSGGVPERSRPENPAGDDGTLRDRYAATLDEAWTDVEHFDAETAADVVATVRDAELAHALVEVETWREHHRHTEAHLHRVEDVRDAAIRHRDELAAELARLRAQVAAARRFAEEMRGYCSPHGVAADYAQRLDAALDSTHTGETGRG